MASSFSSGGQVGFGRLVGKRVIPIRTLESQVMGKSRATDRVRRFERERDRKKREFFEPVTDTAKQTFLGGPTVDGVLLGGTTITVDEF